VAQREVAFVDHKRDISTEQMWKIPLSVRLQFQSELDDCMRLVFATGRNLSCERGFDGVRTLTGAAGPLVFFPSVV
jgi:hypothetical protein